MSVLLFVSLFYIVVFFILCVFSLFIRFDIPNRAYTLSLLVLTVSLCVVAFFSTDNSNGTSGWDINRYYYEIDLMRGKSINYAFKHGLYKDTFLANLLFFVVSRLNNNAWLQTISTFVSMSIFSYVFSSEKRIRENSFSTQSLYMLTVFAVVSFSNILLGVRWVLAVSFCVLGRHLYDKDNTSTFRVSEIVCYCIAVMVHYGVILYLIIRLFSMIKSSLSKYVLCFFTLILPYTEPLVVNNDYLHLAYSKIITYSEIVAPDYRVLLVNIALLLCFFVFEYVICKSNEENEFGKNFIAGLIGSLSIYHLFSRMLGMYVLMRGDAFSESVDEIDQGIVLKIIIIVLCGGLLAYQIVFMRIFWRFTI